MKELTWIDIITGTEGLKGLREENNLSIPIEYINSTRKMVMYLMGVFLIAGFILGLAVKGVLL